MLETPKSGLAVRTRGRSRAGRKGEVEAPPAITAQLDRLRFEDGPVEAEFVYSARAGAVPGIRRNMKLVLMVSAVWSLVDRYVIPESLDLVWLIRYGLVCPVVLAFLGLTYVGRFDRLMGAAFVAVSLVLSGSSIAITIAAGPEGHLYYFAGMILGAFSCSTNPGLRFRVSTLINWACFLAYELAIYLDHTLTSYQLLTNTMWLMATNIATMSTSYAIERHLRSDFWQRRVIRDQADELQKAIRIVEESRKEVERISRTDPLTGLYNRRHFFGEAFRGSGRVSVIILDVDHFKSINDRFGHSAGDRILREIADRIRRNITSEDVACRYGGEEFAILLPEADLQTAALVGERLRRGIEVDPFESDAETLDVTVSVGVATSVDKLSSIEALIDRADRALYKAKNSGRNQVKLWVQERAMAASF